jgi:peptidoglycan/LPS O-acetylase OafA/YrhL
VPKPAEGKSRYMAGLDGLRALAVLAVIAYHLNLPFAPGGLLGVDVFFVLSGYLISDMLLAERKKFGRINMKHFWLRRARRILPALFAMLIVVVVWVTLLQRSQIPALRGDVMAAVLFISNWYYIFHHVSYFAKFGPPSPLTNLWSLAVEEQFYLIWPLFLSVLLTFRAFRRRGPLVVLTLLVTAASAVAMAVLYHPGMNPNRVYYGTDTRAYALLLGAALAMVWPSAKLATTLSRSKRTLLDGIGILGLLTILYMVWQTTQYETFMYRGGMVLLSLAATVLVATLAHPASLLSRLFAWKPLRWIGVRSYAIYLWHYPIIALTSPTMDMDGFNATRDILQVGASIVIAALSWRFVEEPIRHGALTRLWKQVRAAVKGQGTWPKYWWAASSTSFVALMISFVGLANFFPVQAKTSAPSGTEITPTGTNHAAGTDPGTPASPSTSASTQPITTETLRQLKASLGASARTHGTSGQTAPSTGTYPSTAAAVYKQSGAGVTAIGDSIMFDVYPDLKQMLPGIVIDAKVGRQLYQTPPVIQKLKTEGDLGHRAVIIELGTNGSYTKSQLLSLLHSLGPVHRIVLVNTREPRPWEHAVNKVIDEVAATYPHTVLVNWYAVSAPPNDYFWPDHVHLNPTGAHFLASLMVKAVEAPPGTKVVQ